MSSVSCSKTRAGSTLVEMLQFGAECRDFRLKVRNPFTFCLIKAIYPRGTLAVHVCAEKNSLYTAPAL